MFKEFVNALKQRAKPKTEINADGSFAFEEIAHFRGGGMISDAEYALAEQSPTGGRLIIYLGLACVATLIVWASVTRVEEVARSDGKVIPSQTIQIVQSFDGGVLSELLVREGHRVKKDQPLARVETIRADAQVGEVAKRLLALRIKATRLEAEAKGASQVIFDAKMVENAPEETARETALFHARRDEAMAAVAAQQDLIRQREQDIRDFTARRDSATQTMASIQRELEMTRPLLKAGAVSDVEVLRLERDYTRARGDRMSNEAGAERAHAALAEARQRLRETENGQRSRARQELNDTNTEISTLMESLRGAEDRVSKTLLKAPADGVVKTVYFKTVGAVIPASKEVVEIVPTDGSLLIEAKAQTKDIGFIKVGQKATVRFATYDFGIHGSMEGELEHISADSSTDEKGNTYYIIRVRTPLPDPASDKIGSDKKPIIPGMTATVDVLTGQRTVLTYLLKPLIKAKDRAFTER